MYVLQSIMWQQFIFETHLCMNNYTLELILEIITLSIYTIVSADTHQC